MNLRVLDPVVAVAPSRMTGTRAAPDQRDSAPGTLLTAQRTALEAQGIPLDPQRKRIATTGKQIDTEGTP
jgi:hypothetical protein